MRRFLRHISGLMLAAVFGQAAALHAQEAQSDRSKRTDAFGWLLQKRLKPLTGFGELYDVLPEETVIVILGSLSHGNLRQEKEWDVDESRSFFDANQLDSCWKRGAAVLVASGQHDHGLLSFCGLAIDGVAVTQRGRSDDPWDVTPRRWHPPYNDFPQCPLITEFVDFRYPWQHLVLENGLATNGPSVLVIERPGDLTVLAHLPPNCRVDMTGGKRPPQFVRNWELQQHLHPEFAELTDPAIYLMAAAGKYTDVEHKDRRGPIIVMAGEGVFFDGMMCQKDNDNLMFAMNCASFLTNRHGEEGFLRPGSSKPMPPRKYLLFISNGEVLSSFSLTGLIEPKTPGSLPMPVLTTELFNKVLFRLQQEGVLYSTLEGWMSPERGLKLLIAVVSLVLFVYASWRLSRGRWRVDAKVPLVIDAGLGDSPHDAALLTRRAAALVELDNYAEPAQALARQWFWRHAGIAPDQWDHPGFAGPAWRLNGTWLQRWSFGRKLAYIRRLAQDAVACSISGGGFRKLQRTLVELTETIHNGGSFVKSATPA